jgi:hypothetical protein
MSTSSRPYCSKFFPLSSNSDTTYTIYPHPFQSTTPYKPKYADEFSIYTALSCFTSKLITRIPGLVHIHLFSTEIYQTEESRVTAFCLEFAKRTESSLWRTRFNHN